MKPRVLQRGAHAVPAFFDDRVGQPDDRELRKTAGDIDLDIHEMRVETDECRAPHLGEHDNTAFLISPTLFMHASMAIANMSGGFLPRLGSER